MTTEEIYIRCFLIIIVLHLCVLALAVGIHVLSERRKDKEWTRNVLATVNRERAKRGADPLYLELDKVNFPRR